MLSGRRLAIPITGTLTWMRGPEPAVDEATAIRRFRSALADDSVVHTGEASRASRARSLLHAAIGALSWMLIVHLLIWQFVDDAPPWWWFAVVLICVSALAVSVATLVWLHLLATASTSANGGGSADRVR